MGGAGGPVAEVEEGGDDHPEPVPSGEAATGRRAARTSGSRTAGRECRAGEAERCRRRRRSGDAHITAGRATLRDGPSMLAPPCGSMWLRSRRPRWTPGPRFLGLHQPMAIRSSGLMNSDANRNPPARAIASRTGIAQRCSSRPAVAGGISSSTSQAVSSLNPPPRWPPLPASSAARAAVSHVSQDRTEDERLVTCAGRRRAGPRPAAPGTSRPTAAPRTSGPTSPAARPRRRPAACR